MPISYLLLCSNLLQPLESIVEILEMEVREHKELSVIDHL